MQSLKFSPSSFEIPSIKDAGVIKTEIKPFLHNFVYNYTKPLSLKVNLTVLKQFLLLENIWIHIFLILDIDLQLFLQKIHLSKLPFLNKKLLEPKHIRRTIIPNYSPNPKNLNNIYTTLK